MNISGGRGVEEHHETPHDRAWKRPRLQGPIDAVMENGGHVSVGDGAPALPKYLGKEQRFSVQELIRLVNQELRHLGFTDVAETLEQRSRVKLELPEVSRLRESVQMGHWDTAVSLLRELPLGEKERHKATFIILRNKYLEALEAQQHSAALHCLRNELSRIPGNEDKLKNLANLLLCRSPQDLYTTAEWPGSGEGSRLQLLQELQAELPPEIMVPERRLEALVEQALEAQLHSCKTHNAPHPAVSLLKDYNCEAEHVPQHTTQVLMDHAQQVWHLQFSCQGHMLASAAADGTVIVWDVIPGRRRVSLRHSIIKGHTQAIASLAWHPADAFLASCSADCQVKLWDPCTGECKQTLTHHTQGVEAIAWLPDGDKLVTGGRDKRVVLVDVRGQILKEWETGNVHDLLITQDGRYMLMNTNSAEQGAGPLPQHERVPKRLGIFDLTTLEHLPANVFGRGRAISTANIMAMTASRDSQHLLLSLTSQELQGWPLQALLSNMRFEVLARAEGRDILGEDDEQPLKHTLYKGMDARSSTFVMRACYGGINDKFVLSGSNEGLVYMWHRDSGDLLHGLEGHVGPVNAVTWNPADPAMFASCSDDKSIHIWGLESDVPDGVEGVNQLTPGSPMSSS